MYRERLAEDKDQLLAHCISTVEQKWEFLWERMSSAGELQRQHGYTH